MELKNLVILCIFGVAAVVTALPSKERDRSTADLEASFPSSIPVDGRPASSGISIPPPFHDELRVNREKRDLFKKWKKEGGREIVVVNRDYEQGVSEFGRPGREVHHHHHYPYYAPAPPPLTYTPENYPNFGFNGGYYSDGYAAGGNYGVGYGTLPPRAPVRDATPPAETVAVAAGQNAVDRGQGAAAVNNIAIIHARAGQTTNHAFEDETKPVAADDLIGDVY